MGQNFGIIQVSKGNRPDIDAGYTLDDNSRALIVSCKVYTYRQDTTCAKQIKRYLKFIHCDEQPVDVAGTVIALGTFYRCFSKPEYSYKQKEAFSWFLGNNHLNQIVYKSATGDCYEGLEENNINLNQGTESTLCYLMARLSSFV